MKTKEQRTKRTKNKRKQCTKAKDFKRLSVKSYIIPRVDYRTFACQWNIREIYMHCFPELYFPILEQLEESLFTYSSVLHNQCFRKIKCSYKNATMLISNVAYIFQIKIQKNLPLWTFVYQMTRKVILEKMKTLRLHLVLNWRELPSSRENLSSFQIAWPLLNLFCIKFRKYWIYLPKIFLHSQSKYYQENIGASPSDLFNEDS